MMYKRKENECAICGSIALDVEDLDARGYCIDCEDIEEDAEDICECHRCGHIGWVTEDNLCYSCEEIEALEYQAHIEDLKREYESSRF